MDIFKQVLRLQQAPSAGIVGYLTLFSSVSHFFSHTHKTLEVIIIALQTTKVTAAAGQGFGLML